MDAAAAATSSPNPSFSLSGSDSSEEREKTACAAHPLYERLLEDPRRPASPASTRRSRPGCPCSSLQPRLRAVPPIDGDDISSTTVVSAPPTDPVTVSTHSTVAKVSEVPGSISDLSCSSSALSAPPCSSSPCGGEDLAVDFAKF